MVTPDPRSRLGADAGSVGPVGFGNGYCATRCGRCDERAEETQACAGAACSLMLGACCCGASGCCAECDAENTARSWRDEQQRLELAEILLGGARFLTGVSFRSPLLDAPRCPVSGEPVDMCEHLLADEVLS